MPSGICSRRADFAGTITPVGSLIGGGSLPAADRIELVAPRLHAGFSPALRRATPLPRCYGMALLRAAFPEGMTGEPIWSLQSMLRLMAEWGLAAKTARRRQRLVREASHGQLGGPLYLTHDERRLDGTGGPLRTASRSLAVRDVPRADNPFEHLDDE